MYDQLLSEQVASSQVQHGEDPGNFDRMPGAHKELMVHRIQMIAHTAGALSGAAQKTTSSCCIQ